VVKIKRRRDHSFLMSLTKKFLSTKTFLSNPLTSMISTQFSRTLTSRIKMLCSLCMKQGQPRPKVIWRKLSTATVKQLMSFFRSLGQCIMKLLPVSKKWLIFSINLETIYKQLSSRPSASLSKRNCLDMIHQLSPTATPISASTTTPANTSPKVSSTCTKPLTFSKL